MEFVGLMVAAVLACWLVVYLQRRPGSPMTLLVLGLLISFAFPQRFVIAGLDTAGAPSLIVGVALFALWVFGRVRPLHPLDPRPDATPVLTAIFLCAWLIGAALGELRPNPDSSPDALLRGVLEVLSFIGLLLYASHAIRSQRDLEWLLRAVTLLASAVALLGILQFLLRVDPLNAVEFPLLVGAETLNPERTRAGFLRVRGTAFHPIEFSVVLGMLLPLAVGFSLRSDRLATRQLYAVCAGTMGIAAMLSVSRSGVLAIVTGLVVAAVHVSWSERARIAIGGFVGLVIVYLSVPGLLGTFRRLFLNTENDPSIEARLDDIPFVLDVLQRSPLFGDDSPSIVVAERLLDNEFYEQVVGGGLVGLSSLLLLILVPLLLAWARSQIGSDRHARTLAGMVAASLTAGFLSLATFDGLFFKLFTTVLFVLVAAGCASWRLRDEDAATRHVAPATRRVSASPVVE